MTLTIQIPDELAGLLHETEPREDRALLVETVCALYARGRISSGKGARILGLDRWEFQNELNRREIPLHYSLTDLQHDIAFARSE